MKTIKHQLSDATTAVCLSTLESVRGWTALGYALRGETFELVSQPMPDPSEYDPDTFRDAYWASEMWSKHPFEIPGIDRGNAAFASFADAEVQCASSNSRFVEWASRASISHRHIARARQLVSSVLGKFSWDLAYEHCSFGPGATTSMPRAKAARQNKWEFGTHITEHCLPLYLAFRRFNNGWASGDRELTIVRGNKVTTVPKNAKTDRVIAIEPDWNMFFQRGIGGLIRSRVRRRLGLLTPDAQELNKLFAQIGSKDGSFCTIDLSSASDSISLALCEALLPDDWFRAMLTTRSPQGVIGEDIVTYEKISSMGNGFTFELETLIFWALARACCKHGTIRVYGDDIIAPVESAPEIIYLLEHCGFRVNRKKTFVTGPFRESCGGHYHNGVDVTPPYFRHTIDTLPEYIRAANRISRGASQHYGYWRDGRFEYVWNYLAKPIPKFLYGPEQLGDSVLHVPFDAATPQWSLALQKWKVKAVVDVVSKTPMDHLGAMFHSLWGVVSEGSEFAQASRSYRLVKTFTDRWEGPPAWLPEEYF